MAVVRRRLRRRRLLHSGGCGAEDAGGLAPVPEHWPKPLTIGAHARLSANVLELGQTVRGHLMPANVILVRATGADPLALAGVMRGEVAEQVRPEAMGGVEVPVLVLNGRADAANQEAGRLLCLMRNARAGSCDGDHYTTPFEPSFHEAVVSFFREQWRARGLRPHCTSD